MFPKCANSDCAACFGNLRDGKLFRFQRRHATNDVPANSHAVEHAWLCAKCCEGFTLEYRDNCVLVVLVPPVQATSIPPPRRKRRRSARAIGGSSRTPLGSPAAVPVVVLAITPPGGFPERK